MSFISAHVSVGGQACPNELTVARTAFAKFRESHSLFQVLTGSIDNIAPNEDLRFRTTEVERYFDSVPVYANTDLDLVRMICVSMYFAHGHLKIMARETLAQHSVIPPHIHSLLNQCSVSWQREMDAVSEAYKSCAARHSSYGRTLYAIVIVFIGLAIIGVIARMM